MDDWRPIESASKDATEMWLGAEGKVILGYWMPESWRSSWTEDRIQWQPTHWMPFRMPNPPMSPSDCANADVGGANSSGDGKAEA